MTCISQATYETLRTETLSSTVPWVGAETFAQVASWAVWAEQTPTGTGWSRDLTPLTWASMSDRLHNRVLFVALNKGTNPTDVSSVDWSNFHTGRADYKLARAIDQPSVRQVLGGAYITDFFKGLPTPTAAALRQYLASQDRAARTRTVGAMTVLLEREISILGSENPLLVGIGRDAERWLRRCMSHRRVVGITHYSHAVRTEDYASQLAQISDNV